MASVPDQSPPRREGGGTVFCGCLPRKSCIYPTRISIARVLAELFPLLLGTQRTLFCQSGNANFLGPGAISSSGSGRLYGWNAVVAGVYFRAVVFTWKFKQQSHLSVLISDSKNLPPSCFQKLNCSLKIIIHF